MAGFDGDPVTANADGDKDVAHGDNVVVSESMPQRLIAPSDLYVASDQIACGSMSRVYLGRYKENLVAVKAFDTSPEVTYQTVVEQSSVDESGKKGLSLGDWLGKLRGRFTRERNGDKVRADETLTDIAERRPSHEDVMRQRFREGARALETLSPHKSIVGYHGFVENASRPMIVMERLRGTLLSAYKFASDEAKLGFFRQIAEVLDHIHDEGVCLGDLKPMDIMVVEDGDGQGVRPVLFDFSVARIGDSPESDYEEFRSLAESYGVLREGAATIDDQTNLRMGSILYGEPQSL